MSAGFVAELDDSRRQEAIELGELIERAELDWLREALHSVVGVCAHHTGTLPTQILEVLRYELAEDAESDAEGFESGTAFDEDHHRDLLIDDVLGVSR